MIKKWWLHDAEWYEIWYPQSGFIGGLIIAIAAMILIFMVLK